MVKKMMSINDELLAIQSGELKCSPEKMVTCITYCRKRLEVIRKALDSQTMPQEYRQQAETSAERFSGFIRWAEMQGESGKQEA